MELIAQETGGSQVEAPSALQQLAQAQAELIEMKRSHGLPIVDAIQNLARLRRRIARGAA